MVKIATKVAVIGMMVVEMRETVTMVAVIIASYYK
jgi:hypothetical protein